MKAALWCVAAGACVYGGIRHLYLAFKESDIRRALRAAQKEGVDVRIEINPDDRRLSIITLKPGETCESADATENLKDLL